MLTEKDVFDRVGVTEVRIRTWVERGWVSPAVSEAGYVYTEIDVARCNLIRELRDDLDIDGETVPVVLRLLDQIYDLRRDLRTVSKAIEQETTEVSARIFAQVKAARAFSSSE